jgi:hypothetical protein
MWRDLGTEPNFNQRNQKAKSKKQSKAKQSKKQSKIRRAKKMRMTPSSTTTISPKPIYRYQEVPVIRSKQASKSEQAKAKAKAKAKESKQASKQTSKQAKRGRPIPIIIVHTNIFYNHFTMKNHHDRHQLSASSSLLAVLLVWVCCWCSSTGSSNSSTGTSAVVDAFAVVKTPIRWATRSTATTSLASMASDTNKEELVDRLLNVIDQQKKEKENGTSSSRGDSSDAEIKEMIQQLSSTTTTATTTATEDSKTVTSATNTNSSTTDFEALFGYYNVSCTLTARPNDNPVGGKWTRNGSTRHLWVIRRTLQHILPLDDKSTSITKNAVAQAINVIRLDLLFGLIPVWIVLRGDAVPLDQDLNDNDNDDSNDSNDDYDTRNKKKTKPNPTLLPGLSSRAVRAYFDRPRIAFGKRWVFSFGPTSSVVLDAPYADSNIRIGKGGTSGTLFVFARVSEDDTEATEEWKWLLDEDRQGSFVTKRKAAATMGVVATLSALGSQLLIKGVMQKVSIAATLLSTIGLIWVALGTGGIETRGDTYARGK